MFLQCLSFQILGAEKSYQLIVMLCWSWEDNGEKFVLQPQRCHSQDLHALLSQQSYFLNNQHELLPAVFCLIGPHLNHHLVSFEA